MQYRRLGNSGLKVSPLCLGTMQFGWTADEPTSFQVMDALRGGGREFHRHRRCLLGLGAGQPGR